MKLAVATVCCPYGTAFAYAERQGTYSGEANRLGICGDRIASCTLTPHPAKDASEHGTAVFFAQLAQRIPHLIKVRISMPRHSLPKEVQACGPNKCVQWVMPLLSASRQSSFFNQLVQKSCLPDKAACSSARRGS